MFATVAIVAVIILVFSEALLFGLINIKFSFLYNESFL